MSKLGPSLLFSHQLGNEVTFSLFEKAKLYKETQFHNIPDSYSGAVPLLLFFEPSTRTKVSFQMAMSRLGLKPIMIDVNEQSSVVKGETYLDTLKNIMAMKPDLLVVRYGEDKEITNYLEAQETPVINGGGGVSEHPTQALLDAFTIYEEYGQFQNRKILLIGDIVHSRVASSNIHLLTSLGAQVGLFSDEDLCKDYSSQKYMFETLAQALAWADVIMPLRPQKERFKQYGYSASSYAEKFCLRQEHLKMLRSDQIIMHPGPWNESVDIEEAVVNSENSRIFQQVENGVYIRAALIDSILSEKHK